MKDRKVLIVLVLFMILFVMFMKSGLSSTNKYSTKIEANNAKIMNDKWKYKSENITLPTNVNAPVNTEVEINRYLPHILGDNEYLCVITAEQAIEVYIDKDFIYKCGYDGENNLIDLPGDIYNIINLPERAVGKKIIIKYRTKYAKHSGEINEIFYGTKGDIILNIFKHSAFRLLMILFINVIALICLIFCILNRRKKKAKKYIYLVVFCIMISLWMFLESGLTQFFYYDQHVVKVAAYFCIMLAPIPINLFLKNIVGEKKYGNCKIFLYLYIVDFIINFIWVVLRKSLVNATTIFTHFTITVNCFAAFYVMITNITKKNDHYSKYALICMSPILVATVLEVLKYYNKKFIFDTARIFVIGIAFSGIFLISLILFNFISIYKKAKETRMLNILAYQDAITKGKNRTAFYRDINSITGNDMNELLCIMILDMNNLKYVNDKYGHIAGDNAIRLCYECIKSCLHEFGTCYRIGGDEFTCIFTNCSELLIQEFLEKFKEKVNYYNKEVEYNFNVAYGYSFYNKEIDENLLDTFNRADKLMYLKKKIMKETTENYSL